MEHKVGSDSGWPIGTAIAHFMPFGSTSNGDLDMSLQAALNKTRVALVAVCAAAATLAWAHGDVTPQAVDTKGLPTLGEAWRAENPFRDNKTAVEIGTSAYNQNCARCHGLEAISGGIAPDLRKFDNDCASLKDAAKKMACVKENDEYYLTTVRHGRTRNGAVYMPPFEGMFNQEAMWAVKAYLESRRDKPL
jgi:cytochrome c-550 PedF